MTDLLLELVSNGYHSRSGTINKNIFKSKTNSANIFLNSEMRHSKSEDLLNPTSRPPTSSATAVSEDDLIAYTSCTTLLSEATGSQGSLTDRIDPVDSIRDIVSENDLYR